MASKKSAANVLTLTNVSQTFSSVQKTHTVLIRLEPTDASVMRATKTQDGVISQGKL